MRQLLSLLLLAALSGCDGGGAGAQRNSLPTDAAPTNPAANSNASRGASTAGVPVYGYEVVSAYPHDAQAFTQGLVFEGGQFLESTGLERHSTLRRVELQTGKVLQKVDVPGYFFAEGMTLFGGKVYQLTWRGMKGFIYDPKTFEKTGEFKYEGEGWGLTHDADSLILSDGTDEIRFLDPSTYAVKRSISVTDAGRPVEEINELEYVKGEIYANIWHENRVARIDPRDGRVAGWIDLSGLLKPGEVTDKEAVLNGIAYDEQGDRLFVTGKLWPKVFEIKLRQK
ncbi:MAG TPA: glutaminyl-peptide cyclotransferase [Pyrinomonadaceae bacterium]|jgi:glutamine cyclotransferase|nr:glutaminyl-peptide cyclotransferase [Pyrinomonadaceae bacterium]